LCHKIKVPTVNRDAAMARILEQRKNMFKDGSLMTKYLIPFNCIAVRLVWKTENIAKAGMLSQHINIDIIDTHITLILFSILALNCFRKGNTKLEMNIKFLDANGHPVKILEVLTHNMEARLQVCNVSYDVHLPYLYHQN
jgi:hypothetical protein